MGSYTRNKLIEDLTQTQDQHKHSFSHREWREILSHVMSTMQAGLFDQGSLKLEGIGTVLIKTNQRRNYEVYGCLHTPKNQVTLRLKPSPKALDYLNGRVR